MLIKKVPIKKKTNYTQFNYGINEKRKFNCIKKKKKKLLYTRTNDDGAEVF